MKTRFGLNVQPSSSCARSSASHCACFSSSRSLLSLASACRRLCAGCLLLGASAPSAGLAGWAMRAGCAPGSCCCRCGEAGRLFARPPVTLIGLPSQAARARMLSAPRCFSRSVRSCRRCCVVSCGQRRRTRRWSTRAAACTFTSMRRRSSPRQTACTRAAACASHCRCPAARASASVARSASSSRSCWLAAARIAASAATRCCTRALYVLTPCACSGEPPLAVKPPLTVSWSLGDLSPRRCRRGESGNGATRASRLGGRGGSRLACRKSRSWMLPPARPGELARRCAAAKEVGLA
mmetsp:Transcript_9351/g.24651  ORF Transcript_9351/g.24651 Transcript_9351/m.24651 type:complete len:296 (+) Transcript_9351:257-1144(+)